MRQRITAFLVFAACIAGTAYSSWEHTLALPGSF